MRPKPTRTDSTYRTALEQILERDDCPQTLGLRGPRAAKMFVGYEPLLEVARTVPASYVEVVTDLLALADELAR